MSIDPTAQVHGTAVIEGGARLGPEVRVDPFAVIGADVVVEAGCLIGPHAVIAGRTRLGARTRVGAHAVLGGRPQRRDLVSAGELWVGSDNDLRELVTVHAGSSGEVTRLGAGNLLMAYAHVAHDCVVGDACEIANAVQLGGHVRLGDGVTIGGMAALHQFVCVGDLAMIGGGAMVSQDVPPFCQASGDRARVYGINRVGLERAGYDDATRDRIGQAVHDLLSAPTIEEGIDLLVRRYAGSDEVARLIDFATEARRGLCRPVW